MIRYQEECSNMDKMGFQDKLAKDFEGSVLRILLAPIKSSEFPSSTRLKQTAWTTLSIQPQSESEESGRPVYLLLN